MKKRIKGISFLNPVNVEAGYLEHCAQYAIDHGITHFEIIGPTHSPVRGNCDGMMFYQKYDRFNQEKDAEYVNYCLETVNRVLDRIEPYGIKSYYWHHELELPADFADVFPEIRNSDGDVEITHPLIRDFLEHKIRDFFSLYPKMSGIVLTLHETRIPLLKLKHQILDKLERVRYVTQIWYDTCNALGKELIVRPFASIAQDYNDLMNAYKRISPDLIVCDKWTKFDWGLIQPHNSFFSKIAPHPLMVEADIFGEYFGMGYLPIMLKNHIIQKVRYCEDFDPRGYVYRIDRGGKIPFGTPNEVNLEIMDAALEHKDVDQAIHDFFLREYGEFADTVQQAMEGTEELQIKAVCVQEFFVIHSLSFFPGLGTMKRHYRYFRSDYPMAPDAWQKQKGFCGLDAQKIREEKQEAIRISQEKLDLIRTLEGKMEPKLYDSLYMRFYNLNLVARIWEQLAELYLGLARYFEFGNNEDLEKAYATLPKMKVLDEEGFSALGKNFYCEALGNRGAQGRKSRLFTIEEDIRDAVEKEASLFERLRKENLCDFVIPGGFSEEHSLRNEPNFSSPLVCPDGVCRSVGTIKGKAWSVLKAHGWVSYSMAVRPDQENTLSILAKGENDTLSFLLDIEGEVTSYQCKAEGLTEIVHRFTPPKGTDHVRIRFDRNSDSMPFLYALKIL